MKRTWIFSTAFAAFAAALPFELLELRQTDTIPAYATRNDLSDNTNILFCPKAIFIYARGSTEKGNMGLEVGPSVAAGLEKHYGASKIWVEGIGLPYNATLPPNFLPEGTDQESINEMIKQIVTAGLKCPRSKIVAGGYSQGAALTAGALSRLAAPTAGSLANSMANKVVGVVLFGYTRNEQYGHRIPNFPVEKTKIFCNAGDVICEGIIDVTPPHLLYGDAARGPAPDFLVSKIGA